MRAWPLFLTLVPALCSAQTRVADAPTKGLDKDVPRLVVVPVAEVERARIESLYAALEASGARVVDRAARAGLDLPLAPALFDSASVDDARAALLLAKAALRELELEEVDRNLNEALEASLRLPRPTDHPDLLADVLLMRAELALARGKPDLAEHDLRLLARLDERRAELHPGLFPPNVVAAFASARRENAAAQSAYLTISADASGAPLVLLVDGREVALVDARAGLDVASGPHLITLQASGRVTRTFLIKSDPDEPLSLSVQLFAPHADEARATALASLRRAPMDDASLVALLSASGADAALVLFKEEAVAFAPGSGRHKLPVSAADDVNALAQATLSALREKQAAPVVAESKRALEPAADDAGIVPVVIASSAAVLLVVAVLGGVSAAALMLQPGEEVPPPPTPVVIGCCGQGR